MSYKYSCVIDANGNYKAFVLGSLVQHGDGQEWVFQDHTFLEGERIIDTDLPIRRPYAGASGMVSPRWDAAASAWVEGATEEEIEAWEAEHPAPELFERAPTAEEQMRADIDFLAAMTGVEL